MVPEHIYSRVEPVCPALSSQPGFLRAPIPFRALLLINQPGYLFFKPKMGCIVFFILHIFFPSEQCLRSLSRSVYVIQLSVPVLVWNSIVCLYQDLFVQPSLMDI